jgi:hypothetical protein
MLGYEDIRIKIQAIEFLSESEKFSRPVALTLLTFLWRDDYYLVNAVLSLLDNRYDLEQNDLLKISSLLNSKNTNIANRVSYFLISRNINNQHLIDNLNAYSKLNYKR